MIHFCGPLLSPIFRQANSNAAEGVCEECPYTMETLGHLSLRTQIIDRADQWEEKQLDLEHTDAAFEDLSGIQVISLLP